MTVARRATQRRDSEAVKLREFLKRVESYNDDLIFGVARDQKLYHYTDLAGLQGIIGGKDLWLTDPRYSNDSEEMTFGLDVTRRVLGAQRNDWGAISPDRLEYLDELNARLATPQSDAVYIASFCCKGNLLSQWRGYAAYGAGVCIEVDPTGFRSITGEDSPSQGLMRLWKVFYLSGEQENVVAEAIRFGFENGSNLEERTRYAMDALQFFVPTFKHGDFVEENEFRLIFTPPPGCTIKPRFRVARGMLVPYYSMQELTAEPTFQLPLTRIIVGPSPRKKENAASIHALLDACGYQNVVVEMSETPFRT